MTVSTRLEFSNSVPMNGYVRERRKEVYVGEKRVYKKKVADVILPSL